jgi:hypothetical protein
VGGLFLEESHLTWNLQKAKPETKAYMQVVCACIFRRRNEGEEFENREEREVIKLVTAKNTWHSHPVGLSTETVTIS